MGPQDAPPVLPLVGDQYEPIFCNLIDQFKDFYGDQPAFVVRVPGRVNLIGEHIDYCGYSVLPMALDQNILIAGKSTDDSNLHIINADSRYSKFHCNINDLSINIDQGVHWFSYVLCGIRGILEASNDKKLRGMQLAVAGNILPNAGLSSSSALVCASALATSHAIGLTLSKHDLASLCAKCERYIGTEGGGMDQAIAFLAKSGCAKHISFKPLKATDVKIPPGLAIVVAHSLAELNKAASDHFNQRVAECRLASIILAKKSGLENWRETFVLAEVQKELNVTLSDMILRTSAILSKNEYTKEELCKILDLDCVHLDHSYLPENTRGAASFKLRQRATHVFEEALRVSRFQELSKTGGSAEELGQLMNQSHDSLRDLYECSHPQLDVLVSTARSNGALGARLTGAGWGGCIVALTTEEHADTLISSLKEKFYSTLSSFDKTEQEKYVFHSQPSKGAVIYQ